jgi:hypothetical protein
VNKPDASLRDHAEIPEARANRGFAMTTVPNFEEIQKFGKQHIEAVNATTAVFAKGLQEIGAEATDYSKNAFAANAAVIEKLLGAKTVESAIQIQTDFAKAAYQGFLVQATKISELYAKLGKEAFKPVETAVAKTQSK